MKFTKLAMGAAVATAMLAGPVLAGSHGGTKTLRIQTHQAIDSPAGLLYQIWKDDVETMSNGSLSIEMFYSSSVVGSVETFDAAANGILDCDMTGGAYQTGKNAAFQFVGDIMGGYDTPWQQYSWLYYGDGYNAAQELYNNYGMQLIGWTVFGQESLSSSKPLRGFEDLKDWKFRSPPGLETEIFAGLGASPIVMDYTEIFTALETGIIDGADASSLANNVGAGLYDLVSHATYPGFHSMPSDHLACNKAVWDGLTESQRRIIETAMQKVSLHAALQNEKKNAEAVVMLTAKGVTLHDWSAEDRMKFRQIAQEAWNGWAAKTPEAAALVESHRKYLGQLGLIAK